MRHLSAHNLLSDCQYGFRKGQSTGDLAFRTEIWSSSLGTSVKPLLSALTHRKHSIVWHKSSISKLPFYGFYPSLCTFISSFLSDRSSAAVLDGHCSFPKPKNSGVLHGSALSPTLFLLFINDLNLTQCPIHSYADDTTLHFSTSYNRRPTHQELSDLRRMLFSSLFCPSF